MLPDVRLHVRRNEPGDGLPGLQARADVGRRHVRRCRLDEENRVRDSRAEPSRHRARSFARPAPAADPARREIETGARDDDKIRQVEDVGIAVPRFNFCKRIGAGDEENLRWVETRSRSENASACPTVYDGPGADSSMSLAREALDRR